MFKPIQEFAASNKHVRLVDRPALGERCVPIVKMTKIVVRVELRRGTPGLAAPHGHGFRPRSVV